MALTIDDGTDAVPTGLSGPGGMAGPVERVVVVGAGIAGLTVANALTAAGVACVVVEARSRIGGRLHTIDLGGTPVDLGGSWIHHPDGNPLTRWADHIGLARVPGDCGGVAHAYDLGAQRPLSTEDVARLDHLRNEAFPAFVDTWASRPDRPADEVVRAFAASVAGPLAPLAGQVARSAVEADAGARAEETSTHWLAAYEDVYGGPSLGPMPADGYRALLAPLAAPLTIVTGFEVAAIGWGGSGVVVTAVDGRVETGSHVVVTVPLGVLQQSRPTFHPPLPASHQSAIDRLGFSSMEKVVLAFAEPVAPPPARTALFPPDRDEAPTTLWNFGVGPVLVATVMASATQHMLDVPAADAVAWALAGARSALGPLPDPVATHVTGWRRDRFSLGSYTHVAPGQPLRDPATLAEPVGGRLLFAGEHTDIARLGYADGAMTSAIRVAKRLLTRAAVTLRS